MVLYLRLVPVELNQMQIPNCVYMKVSKLYCSGLDLRCYWNHVYTNTTEKHYVSFMFVHTANKISFLDNYVVLIQVRIEHRVCAGHTAGTFIVRECCGYH